MSLNPLGKKVTILVMIDIDRVCCPVKVGPDLERMFNLAARRKALGDLSSTREHCPGIIVAIHGNVGSRCRRALRVQILQSVVRRPLETVAVKQRKRGVPPAPAAPRGLAWVTTRRWCEARVATRM
jgi:hypothetical protein